MLDADPPVRNEIGPSLGAVPGLSGSRNWAPDWPGDLEGSAPDRLDQIVRWERDTLRDKYEYAQACRIATTYAFGTAELDRLTAQLLRPVDHPGRRRPVARCLGVAPGRRLVFYYPRRGFDLWNTRYFILPTRLALGSYRTRGFVVLPAAKPN